MILLALCTLLAIIAATPCHTSVSQMVNFAVCLGVAMCAVHMQTKLIVAVHAIQAKAMHRVLKQAS